MKTIATGLLGILMLSSMTISVAMGTQSTTTRFGYDAAGNLTLHVDPLGRPTTFLVDNLNRHAQVRLPTPDNGARTVIGMAYDSRDSVESVSDPRGLITRYGVDGFGQKTTIGSPDTGNTVLAYDRAGNVISSTDARGKTTRFTYDALNRLTNTSGGTGSRSHFEYDGGASQSGGAIGKLTAMIDASGRTTFSYDGGGRVSTKTQTTIGAAGRTLTLKYEYGTQGPSIGKTTNLTFPSGNRVIYAYDAAGRIGSISIVPVANSSSRSPGTDTVLLKNIRYSPTGAVTGWDWGNHSAASPSTYARLYDIDGRVISYPLGHGARGGLMRHLEYNAASQIIAMKHTGVRGDALDQTFAYDVLGRLSRFSSASTSQEFAYDRNGNRYQARFGNTTYVNSISPSSNQMLASSGPAPARTNKFDAAGNLISDGTMLFSYNDQGRLIRSIRGTKATDYLYNALGQRVAKLGSAIAGGGVNYIYDKKSRLIAEYGSKGEVMHETIYLYDMPVGVIRAIAGPTTPESISYVYADHINTPRVITRARDNAMVWRWDDADPFGIQQPNENPANFGVFIYNLRFPGQTYDREINTHYNYFRDYDPQTGRYLQSDPIGLGGGMNTYGYSDANPITRFDPSGEVATVVVNGNNVSITLGMSYDGPGATLARQSQFNGAIENSWSGKFGKYNVKTTVVPGRHNGEGNLVTIPLGRGRATTGGIGGTTGKWPAESGCKGVAHEAGHLMDIADRYNRSGPWEGWEGNIMAEPEGKVDERNIEKIIERAHWRRTPGAKFVEP